MTPLSPEEKRIAVAKAAGWTFHKIDYAPKGGAVFESFWLRPGVDIAELNAGDICHREGTTIPDYARDLDAMHEAEKVLTDTLWPYYANAVFKETGQSGRHPGAHEIWRRLLSATAAQRMEAFGKALGLWT